MIDELLINLDPPITFNGTTIDNIVLKEPTAAQLEKGGKGTVQETLGGITTFQIELVMAVTGQPKQIIGQMRISDLHKAFKFIMGFIEDSPAISPT